MSTAGEKRLTIFPRTSGVNTDSIRFKAADAAQESPAPQSDEQLLGGQDTITKRLVLTLNTSVPNPIMPKNMKKLQFLGIDATEFARQLTIMESRLYGKIKPTKCLNKAWQKKVSPKESEPAPNVKALIWYSNQLTNWIAQIILTQSDVKKRAVVIKHFVSIADVHLALTYAIAIGVVPK